MNIVNLLWLVLILVVPTIIGLIFLLFPERLVQWRTRGEFEWRKDILKMSDKDIDRVPMLPTDRYLLVRRSDFVNRGREHPKDFPRLITVYRLVGIMFLGMAIATAIILWQLL